MALTAGIIGTGSYLPKRIVTNEDLESMVRNFRVEDAKKMLSKRGIKVDELSDRQLFDAWARQVTGIENRRFYDKDFNKDKNFIGDTENMGAEASKREIGRASCRERV